MVEVEPPAAGVGDGLGAVEILLADAQKCFGLPVQGHLGAERQARQRRTDDEHRHQQKGIVGTARIGECALTCRRTPDGEAGQHECDRRRIARPPAQPRPQQGNHGQEAHRGFGQGHRVRTEDYQTDAAGRRQEKQSFEQVVAVPGPATLVHPQHDDGREQERARGITHPPGRPDRGKVPGPNEPAEPQRRDADRRADQRGRSDTDQCELRHLTGAVEGARPAAPSLDEPAADDRLEGIAERDGERRCEGARCRGIGDQRSGEHARPDAIAEQQHHGQGEPGWRPHGTGTGVQ